ncbi:hypothetical protein HZQ84_10550 [Elizabethkingia anophelis]|uniref:hypothetical protein n=1 Tax=Elizabethkingia anophelis TaxID=1117645 RepID=UPI000999A32F|nr:hypothetical protein [Elizabethkingia anophelis]MCT3720486.1 hypothetical protein [Elizabethkingia anophelis]MCT3723996.1 hypothetical protein [Elizabethkingia anophelis]MDV3491330.1 hypothetical protein [Elizabethkingia anophelis]MDV4130958.1 hypothetical protein [Elizabethkingia anophelis]MDV4134019.1 hypothetical protein [Elizabethkingia anophelis]
MRKLTLIFISALGLKAHKIPTYREVSVCGQEGMSNKAYFARGKTEYLNILKDFEKKFKTINNGYSDYYRLYILPGGINATDLFVSLIPKSIVSEENKKKKEYRVFGDERTLRLNFNLKTKKISNIYKGYILPDL